MRTTEELVEAFSPDKLRVSPKFSAILCYLLGGDEWTTPSLVSLATTSDGYLMGRDNGDRGFDTGGVFLGAVSDLNANLAGVADVLELTVEERGCVAAIMAQHLNMDNWGNWNPWAALGVV